MNRQRNIGIMIFILSILQLSVLMAVGGILGVISWIGYNMATSRPSTSSLVSDEKK